MSKKTKSKASTKNLVPTAESTHAYLLGYHKVCGIFGVAVFLIGVVLTFMAQGTSNELLSMGVGAILIGVFLAAVNLMEWNHKSSKVVENVVAVKEESLSLNK